MQSVSIRELKKNPTAAIRRAQADAPVLVTNRDSPQALLVGFDDLSASDPSMLRLGLALSLYRDGSLSLGAAARLAGQTLSAFLAVLSARQIPVCPEGDELAADLDVLNKWLAQEE